MNQGHFQGQRVNFNVKDEKTILIDNKCNTFIFFIVHGYSISGISMMIPSHLQGQS